MDAVCGFLLGIIISAYVTAALLTTNIGDAELLRFCMMKNVPLAECKIPKRSDYMPKKEATHDQQ